MKKNRWFAVFTALALAFTMFGCKPEIKYVDKTYCESVTFASEATENGVKELFEAVKDVYKQFNNLEK